MDQNLRSRDELAESIVEEPSGLDVAPDGPAEHSGIDEAQAVLDLTGDLAADPGRGDGVAQDRRDTDGLDLDLRTDLGEADCAVEHGLGDLQLGVRGGVLEDRALVDGRRGLPGLG